MSVHASVVFRGFEVRDVFECADCLENTWAHFRVKLGPFAPQQVNDYPGLAEKLLKAYPHLRRHRCDNHKHASFLTELPTTEIAHALEHLMVELLAQESNLSRLDIKGQTAWDFKRDGAGAYRLRIQGFSSEDQARRISQQACVIFQDLSR